MARTWIFALAALLAVLVLLGWHYYLWMRLVRDPGWSEGVTRALGIVVVVLAALIPVAFVGSRVFPPGLARVVSAVAYGWMGAGFLLLCLVAAGDLFSWVLSALRILEPTGGTGGEVPDPERRVVLARTLAAGTTLAAAATTVYGVRGALAAVQVREVEVPIARLPRALSGLTIVQLTDIHVGALIGRSFVEGIVERTRALEPDLVALTGDLVDGSVPRLAHAVAPIARLEARFGTYFVTGNHEYYSGVTPWVAALRRMGIEVLENRRVTVGERGGPGIDLVGIPDPTAERMGPVAPDLAGALAGRDPDRALVLLAHQPRAIFEAAGAGVDLQISGHTHGGQIWPFGLLVRLTQPYLSGLHRHGDTQIYVSRGTGYWGPPMRVGAPAEITRLVLVPG